MIVQVLSATCVQYSSTHSCPSRSVPEVQSSCSWDVSSIISDDNRKISVLMGTPVRVCFMCMSFQTYRRDVNPFETDVKGRLFVFDVSV